MTPAEILKAAKAKIADPANWCKGHSARDEDGSSPTSKPPIAWCAVGSVWDVAGLLGSHDALALLFEASRYLFKDIPAHVNDTRTHADVMAMFDKAIELAEASA